MIRITLKSVLSALALSALAATGCAQQSQPSSFYLLSYEPGSSRAAQTDAGPTTTDRRGLALGVGPIELPQYLDRPQVVTRDGTNEMVIDEFSRWGGRLSENFTTVLAEALSAELASDRVSIYPWNLSAPIEYQVTVRVTAFEADAAGASILDARWSVVDVRKQEVMVMARSRYRQPAQPGAVSEEGGIDYETVAAAMSRDVVDFAREIADRIKALPGA